MNKLIIISLLFSNFLFGNITVPFSNQNYNLTLLSGYNKGYTIVIDEFEIEDFKILNDQKVNLVRCMLYRTWTQNDKQSLVFYQAWLDEELIKLDLIISEAKKYDIRVIIDLHTLPGELYEDGSNRVFYEEKYADYFLKVWEQIVIRYQREPILYAFELFNEPVEMSTNKSPIYDTIELQILAAKIVRNIDTKTPIIFASNLWNTPDPFFEEPITEINNIIYSVHFYQDMKYTHQGISGFNQDKISYPGRIGLWYFDKNSMINSLKKVRDFQLNHDIKIFVGEFSVVRWSEGGAQWLEDAISIFEEYEWDWTYHAWCNYHNNTSVETLWSIEAENGSWGDYSTVISKENTDRKTIILNALQDCSCN